MKLRPNSRPKFSQRQLRAIEALLAALGFIPYDELQHIGSLNGHIQGSISREETDRITGASNSPEIVRQLRKRFGYECIETLFFQKIDRDGLPVRVGHYRVTPLGIRPLLEALVFHDEA